VVRTLSLTLLLVPVASSTQQRPRFTRVGSVVAQAIRGWKLPDLARSGLGFLHAVCGWSVGTSRGVKIRSGS